MWWRLWPQTAWVWILSPPQAIKAWFSPMQKGGGHSVYFIMFLFWGLNKIIYSKRFEWCWHIGSTQLELKGNNWHPHYPHKILGPEDRKQVIARKARAGIPQPGSPNHWVPVSHHFPALACEVSGEHTQLSPISSYSHVVNIQWTLLQTSNSITAVLYSQSWQIASAGVLWSPFSTHPSISVALL